MDAFYYFNSVLKPHSLTFMSSILSPFTVLYFLYPFFFVSSISFFLHAILLIPLLSSRPFYLPFHSCYTFFIQLLFLVPLFPFMLYSFPYSRLVLVTLLSVHAFRLHRSFYHPLLCTPILAPPSPHILPLPSCPRVARHVPASVEASVVWAQVKRSGVSGSDRHTKVLSIRRYTNRHQLLHAPAAAIHLAAFVEPPATHKAEVCS